MDSDGRDYGRDVFAFIDELERLPLATDVVGATQKAFGKFGFDVFCFNGLPQPHQDFDEVVLAVSVPPEWFKIYLEEEYSRVDHTLRHLKQAVQPFAVDDVPYDREREPRTAELMERSAEFGLVNGYWVPIPGPAGCEGGVWMGGRTAELTARTKPMLHLMALYAFDRLRQIQNWVPSPTATLTSREREVLTWVAQGKSAWEIGEILCIAKRTVDEHVQNALRKLGAANRTQAVAVALRDRLICL